MNEKPRADLHCYLHEVMIIYVQNFRIFLPAGDFRRFEIKQKKLIREIQKIPTVFVFHSF